MTATEWTILALLVMFLALVWMFLDTPVVDDEPTPPDKEWIAWEDYPDEADPRRRRYDA